MSYPQCRTCKWWGPREGEYRIHRVTDPAWGDCALTESAMFNTIKFAWSKAVAEETDDSGAWLATAPDFGCNQHEPKERKWQQVRAPNWDEDTVTIDLDKMFGQWGRST